MNEDEAQADVRSSKKSRKSNNTDKNNSECFVIDKHWSLAVKVNDQDDRQPKKMKSNVTLDDKETVDVNSNNEIPEMKYSLRELYCMVKCAGVYDSICCKTISHKDIPHSKYQQAILRTVKIFSKYCNDEFKQ